MVRQLSCGITPEDFDEKPLPKLSGSATFNDSDPIFIQMGSSAPTPSPTQKQNKDADPTKAWFWSSNTVDVEGYDAPTRHRRETEHTELPATLSTLFASTKVLSKSKMMVEKSTTSSSEEVEEYSKVIDNTQKILIRNENFDDVETFNPETGPQLPKQFEELISDNLDIEDRQSNSLDDINIEKHVENFDNDRDNFFAAAEMPQMDQPYNNSAAPEKTEFFYVTTTTNTNKVTTIKIPNSTPVTQGSFSHKLGFSTGTKLEEITTEGHTVHSSTDGLSTTDGNRESDFPSVINQGQLFNLNEEPGVPQEWLNYVNEWNETNVDNVTVPPETSPDASKLPEDGKTSNFVQPTKKAPEITKASSAPGSVQPEINILSTQRIEISTPEGK